MAGPLSLSVTSLTKISTGVYRISGVWEAEGNQVPSINVRDRCNSSSGSLPWRERSPTVTVTEYGERTTTGTFAHEQSVGSDPPLATDVQAWGYGHGETAEQAIETPIQTVSTAGGRR